MFRLGLTRAGYSDVRIIGFSGESTPRKGPETSAKAGGGGGKFSVVPYGRSKPEHPNVRALHCLAKTCATTKYFQHNKVEHGQQPGDAGDAEICTLNVPSSMHNTPDNQAPPSHVILLLYIPTTPRVVMLEIALWSQVDRIVVCPNLRISFFHPGWLVRLGGRHASYDDTHSRYAHGG